MKAAFPAGSCEYDSQLAETPATSTAVNVPLARLFLGVEFRFVPNLWALRDAVLQHSPAERLAEPVAEPS